jgi:DNA-binding LytR/AlgR family response regulator
MLRIAIVEDSESDRNKLKELIHQYVAECNEECDIQEFSDGFVFLTEYRMIYDLVLLDVEMPRMNGMDTAKELREIDPSVLLIFVTNMAQYALKGYEVDALDYVLKPVTYYAFAMKLKKVQRILRERSQEYLMLPFEDELRKVPVSSILYIEVKDHTLCYHTYEGTSFQTGSLKVLEQKLAPFHFSRCNNCYLVNLIHVRSVTQEAVRVENEELKISRPRRKQFMQALSDYYGGGGR